MCVCGGGGGGVGLYCYKNIYHKFPIEWTGYRLLYTCKCTQLLLFQLITMFDSVVNSLFLIVLLLLLLLLLLLFLLYFKLVI